MGFKQFILEDNGQYTVFFDLDSTLANFIKKALEHNPQWSKEDLEQQTMSDEEFWPNILKIKNFWEDLEPIKSGMDMLKYAVKKGFNVEILSSPSRSDKRSVPGKHVWVKKHLSKYNLKVNLVRASKKPEFAHPKALLIDDLKKNIQQFKSKDGQTLLFKDGETTMSQFKKALDKMVSKELTEMPLAYSHEERPKVSEWSPEEWSVQWQKEIAHSGNYVLAEGPIVDKFASLFGKGGSGMFGVGMFDVSSDPVLVIGAKCGWSQLTDKTGMPFGKFPKMIEVATTPELRGKGAGVAFHELMIKAYGGIVSDNALFSRKKGSIDGIIGIWLKHLSRKYEVVNYNEITQEVQPVGKKLDNDQDTVLVATKYGGMLESVQLEEGFESEKKKLGSYVVRKQNFNRNYEVIIDGEENYGMFAFRVKDDADSLYDQITKSTVGDLERIEGWAKKKKTYKIGRIMTESIDSVTELDQALDKIANGIKDVRMSKHFIERIEQRGIPMEEIAETIEKFLGRYENSLKQSQQYEINGLIKHMLKDLNIAMSYDTHGTPGNLKDDTLNLVTVMKKRNFVSANRNDTIYKVR